jgi:hypothetical protein
MKTNLLATGLLLAVVTLPTTAKEEAGKSSVVAQSTEAPTRTPWKSFTLHPSLFSKATPEKHGGPSLLISYNESHDGRNYEWSQAIWATLSSFFSKKDGVISTKINPLDATNDCVQAPKNLTKGKDGAATLPIKINTEKCMSPIFQKNEKTVLIACNSGKEIYTVFPVDEMVPVEAEKEEIVTEATAPQTK